MKILIMASMVKHPVNQLLCVAIAGFAGRLSVKKWCKVCARFSTSASNLNLSNINVSKILQVRLDALACFKKLRRFWWNSEDRS